MRSCEKLFTGLLQTMLHLSLLTRGRSRLQSKQEKLIKPISKKKVSGVMYSKNTKTYKTIFSDIYTTLTKCRNKQEKTKSLKDLK